MKTQRRNYLTYHSASLIFHRQFEITNGSGKLRAGHSLRTCGSPGEAGTKENLVSYVLIVVLVVISIIGAEVELLQPVGFC